MDSPSALEKIQKLLEKYAEVVKEGRVSKYNEEMTKKDFILPLFDALGWKTADSREVTAEEKISKKRVDYGFRINGIPTFFLEAKSLKEDLDNPKFFEQAVSYAWHKGCTWAVLTNFARVKILNAEWRARNYLQSHFMTLEHWEFVKRFEDLSLLSRESFEKDKLDQLAERYGKKTKKESVDKQLLNDFTRFRDILSRNITKLNADKNLSEEELDESVQRILDRLIFIRNCEDRELEPKNLISNYRQWTSRGKGKLVKSLRDDFAYFDEQYNSKLFAEHLCDSLEIDNDILEEVIVGLYYTKDKAISYDFSIIDADVLGSIYEQYLGHVLKKTEKRAKVTKSRIHRKEQGIYYTPTYVVNYIVNNTLGELLKRKKINAEKIRVLDPACGSGSFLIKAFDVLNEYYEQNKDYQQTELDLQTGIPFTTKVKILQNNIFGVDLDKQAVEIAQLNLLLKIAEKGHRLPLLEQSIKCGNSLIDDEKVAGSKAFKWEEEFEEIMKDGGFDVVIGNPPYYNIETFSSDEEKGHLKKFEVYAGHSDILYYFYNKGISLLKSNGMFGFITSRYFLEATYARKLREYILENCEIVKIIDLSNLPVFKDVGIHTVILILKKVTNKPDGKNRFFYKNVSTVEKLTDVSGAFIKQNELDDNAWILGTEKGLSLFRKISTIKAVQLGSISTIEQGQKTGLNVAFTVTAEIIRENNLEKEFIKKLVKNSYINPYYIEDKGLYLIYASDEINANNAPNILEYLKQFKNALEAREVFRNSNCPWYRLQRPRRKEPFEAKEKIIVPYRSEMNRFGYDNQQRYNDGGDVRIIALEDPQYPVKYVLAILNSKLMNFYYRFIGRKKGNVYEYFVEPLQKIPIVAANTLEKEQLILLVNSVLVFSKRLHEIGDKKTDERKRLGKQIAKIESEIDELIYKIYGIADAEKEIIENSLK